MSTIEKIEYFSPDQCFNSNQRPSFGELPLNLADSSVDKDTLEMQWRQLGAITFNEIFPGASISETSAIRMWSTLKGLSTATGELKFKELSEFAIRTLTLPISNATVERVFSVINATKTKVRNKMGQEMLVALLKIKIHNSVKQICCNSFSPTEKMLELFDSKIYDSDEPTVTVANMNQADEELLFSTIEMINF